MKILFVVPKNKSLFGDAGMTAHPHIGIAYLTSFLKQNNVRVAIFDEGIEGDLKKLFSLIDEFKPALIGITIFSYSYGFAYNLIKRIKEKSSISIVAGGPHVCAVKGRLLEDTGIDFAVKQEGELTLLELLQESSKQNPDYSKIKGLMWRGADKILENPNRNLISDLDSLPFPDYDSFGITRYVCYKQRTLPLITSRGCPYGCNYCSVRLSMGQGFRARSERSVFSEIKYFYERGWRNFDVNDDCFTLDKQRAENICDLLIENKLNIRFQLYNGIRVDTVNPRLLKKMKLAGCYLISYGCEAGSDKVLRAIKKGITLEQVRDAVRWANEAGIPNSVNFIIGHKEETYQDALDTLRFARSLPTNFVNFYNLLPYPGTESFEWARQHANFLVPPDSFLEDISYRDNQPVFETQEFTKDQRQRVISLGFNLYRKKILTFRMGRLIGNLVYWATACDGINKFASRFALNNPLGRFIYTGLSKKSYLAKEGKAGLVKVENKDWLGILLREFDHPAIVLWRAVELRYIEKMLNTNPLKDPMLDLGCAEGKIAAILFNGRKLIGIDNCWELLRHNKKTDVYRALVLADACRMPYRDNTFLSVFSNCVIEHIPDIDCLLDEVRRVLRDKGDFFFTVPSHKFADSLFFSVIFNKLGLKGLSEWYKTKRNRLLHHFHCYDHNRWKNILSQNGFTLINYSYYMTEKATFIWDFLAAAVFILKAVWPLNYLLPKIKKRLAAYLKVYYDADSAVGSGLLLVAQKQSR